MRSITKKGQHETDVTSIVGGIIFIAIALFFFMHVAEENKKTQQEKILDNQQVLRSRQYIRTLLQTPIDKNGEQTVTDMVQEYYYYYLKEEYGREDCSECRKRMSELKNLISEQLDKTSGLVISERDLHMFLMVEKNNQGTEGDISFDIAKESKCDKSEKLSKTCIPIGIDDDAVYLPIKVPEQVKGYEDYVIAVTFNTRWLNTKPGYENQPEGTSRIEMDTPISI
ncbi:MAG: hypothetical protein ACLFTH_00145 [Candidatus Woesearchaeota archaeon]